jgi:ankyrin repeat protein
MHHIFLVSKSSTKKMNRFRWAVCQLDMLGKCRNPLALRKSLAGLPPTLDETYERILYAIDEEDSEYAVRILRWLAFSCRPLLVEEVAEVVAIDIERNPAFDSEEVLEDPLEVLSICSSLVTITTIEQRLTPSSNGHSTTVTLAHYSVKEYLCSDRSLQGRAARYSIREIDCNEFIAKSCISYLLQFQIPGCLSESIHESKLAMYAANFWITHTQAVSQQSETLNRVIMKLFSAGNAAYLNWTQIYKAEQFWKATSFSKDWPKDPAPLYYASLNGLTEIVGLLLSEAVADVNARGGEYGTALNAALAGGFNKIADLLLSNGADVNALSSYYGTPLVLALVLGDKNVIKLLLSKGADVNAQSGYYGTALIGALVLDDIQVIELLLSNGADVNMQGGRYGTPLVGASVRGQYNIVELLLSHGANVNEEGLLGNALYVASKDGHYKIVELLLNKGANVNAKSGHFGNALNAASSGGYDDIIELLLSKGAGINAIEGRYGTALATASLEGHVKIVELLISKAADVNAVAEGYESALSIATNQGNNKVVELLLRNGAHPS